MKDAIHIPHRVKNYSDVQIETAFKILVSQNFCSTNGKESYEISFFIIPLHTFIHLKNGLVCVHMLGTHVSIHGFFEREKTSQHKQLHYMLQAKLGEFMEKRTTDIELDLIVTTNHV